jgi:nicotinate phosphoribosyltransferase
MMGRKWRIASEDEILHGKTTDVYFNRTVEILEKENLNPIVHAEFTVSGMPKDMEWGVLAGANDALKLLEGKRVDVYGLSEGTVFQPRTKDGVKTPVLVIEGPYTEFAIFETPILGFICHTSGMVTKTAHVRISAGDKSLLSFGARRTHPAITPQVGYAAYIGGCDGISCVLGAELLDLDPTGTMPHALIIVYQDHVKAWKAYDSNVGKEIPRIALTDTYMDEVMESVLAAENIDNLMGVRLDTPSSRKGNFVRILQEVRWELNQRGFNNVKIFVSGGLDTESVKELRDAGADGFGVGGAISNAPAIDFAMDIVAIQRSDKWIPCAKRGKFSGRKIVWRCPECLVVDARPWNSSPPLCNNCQKPMEKATMQLMKKGKIVQEPKSPKGIRDYVLKQIRRIQT